MSPTTVLSTGKREQTKLANRQAILDAAREVFAELGYETATVRDIIRRTELSVGAFYNYFRSREEVFEALADDGARRFRPILRACWEQAEDFEGYLRAAIQAYFDFLADEHESWQARRPIGERHPHVSMETPEMERVFEEVREAFTAAIERGGAPRVDADYLTAACIAMAREVGERMLMRRPIDTAAAADFAARMILGGLPALPRLREP
ncbi:TetR family transcriptional regulator [Caulobacter sp. SLTY]|uniref:TetR/AcrR family transcriptional regulator n=1 Tax=Caulobacter sp. SLTY TaxID=2683262 RepID=UPI00141376FE|nr:TetR/AcrR family transcriptional regulator [Caulobacter sp. SLTY]NBB16725.1 TetR family transcriptional regulator [Caulobacter sp. SLTY]NBB16775.1 TetR family transcriptional regulator [Caulobacter sp. SLTY]